MIRSTGLVLGVSLAVLAVVCVGLSVWWYGFASAGRAETPTPPVLDDPPKKTEFGTGAAPQAGITEIKFDGERAMKYLRQLCDIGPRVSGTEGMRKQQDLIEKHFKQLGATVTRQEFTVRQRSRREDTPMTNLIVTWHPDRARRVLICAHYDTRPIADQEPNRANWNRPFLSANDGTGGVALMMELGHHVKDLRTEFGIDFVMFDGEEYVFETDRFGGGDKYFFGSEHFADDYLKTRNSRKHRYEAGVLLDLCTAKGAVLKVEQHSFTMARTVCEQIWKVAAEIGAKSFRYEPGPEVLDDHIALNKAGIPTVDIIDFDYPHWHKLSDTPDKVSAEQTAEVARVLATWVQRIR
jgi:glutaminyl-peptide cyclotransferase